MRRLCIFLVLTVMFAGSIPAHAQPGIHNAIDAEDMEQYARWLALSPEQEHAMRRVHEEYIEQWDAFDDRRDALIRVREEFFETYSVWSTTLAEFEQRIDEGRDLPTLAKKGNGLAAELRAAYAGVDELFFTELESILSDAQLQQMPRVRYARQRHIYHPTVSGLPEGKFDMIKWFQPASEHQSHTSSRGAFELSADDYALIEPAIAAFEPLFVVALRAYWHASWRADEPRFIMMHLSRYEYLLREHHGVDPDFGAEMDQHRRAFRRLKLRAVRSVERANRQGLAMFMAALPEQRANELHQFYHEAAYPEIFPDRSHADPLYDAVLAFEDLSDDQRSAVHAMRDDYERRHAQLSDQMIEHIRTRHLARFNDRSVIDDDTSRGAVIAEQREHLRTTGNERLALNEAQAKVLSELLTPEQIERMPAWDFTADPQPRPWDHTWREPRRSRRSRSGGR